jgi:hypothetical protein
MSQVVAFGNVLDLVTAYFSIRVHVIGHLVLQPNIYFMSRVVCEKLPEQLVEPRPIPVFRATPDVKSERLMAFMKSLA